MSRIAVALLVAASVLVGVGLSGVFGPPDDVGGVYIALGVGLAVLTVVVDRYRVSPRFREATPDLARRVLRVLLFLGALWSGLVVLVMAQWGGFQGSDYLLLLVPGAIIGVLWWFLDRWLARIGRR